VVKVTESLICSEMKFKIQLKIKNKYEFKSIDLDFFGDDLAVALENDNLFLFYFDLKLIRLDVSISEYFDKEIVLRGCEYVFKTISYQLTKDNEYIDFEFEVDLIEQNQIKIEYAKRNLNIFNNKLNNKIIGIYLFRIDDLSYIGQSSHIYRRLDNHLNSLNEGNHHNNELQDAWNQGFEKISIEVLEKLDNQLTPMQQQEWLAEKEIQYIEKFADCNLANKTKGELIITNKSYAEYMQRNSSIENKIKSERKNKKIQYQEMIDAITINNQKIRNTIDSIDLQIKKINANKTSFESFVSFFGFIKEDEKNLLNLKANQKQLLTPRDVIFDLNHKMSQLRKRKFTEEEVKEMKKLGRVINLEYHKFKNK
jgi:hypothetical protein